VVLDDNQQYGIQVYGAHSAAGLDTVSVTGTRAYPDRRYGRGVMVGNGAFLDAVGLVIDNNAEAGLWAEGPGSTATARGVAIEDTRESGTYGMGMGVVAVDGARVEVGGSIRANNGPAAVVQGAFLTLSAGTTIEDATFAGVVVADGTFTWEEGAITGVTPHASLGGGVGIFAHGVDTPPDVDVTGISFADVVGGVWMDTPGTYQISGCTLTGTGAGYGLFGAGGTTTWSGTTGLLLAGNTITDWDGGVVFDHATGTVNGTTWSGNRYDVVQTDCEGVPPVAGDVLGRTSLCDTSIWPGEALSWITLP
jgi:hypothetical protein